MTKAEAAATVQVGNSGAGRVWGLEGIAERASPGHLDLRRGRHPLLESRPCRVALFQGPSAGRQRGEETGLEVAKGFVWGHEMPSHWTMNISETLLFYFF